MARSWKNSAFLVTDETDSLLWWNFFRIFAFQESEKQFLRKFTNHWNPLKLAPSTCALFGNISIREFANNYQTHVFTNIPSFRHHVRKFSAGNPKNILDFTLARLHIRNAATRESRSTHFPTTGRSSLAHSILISYTFEYCIRSIDQKWGGPPGQDASSLSCRYEFFISIDIVNDSKSTDVTSSSIVSHSVVSGSGSGRRRYVLHFMYLIIGVRRRFRARTCSAICCTCV